MYHNFLRITSFILLILVSCTEKEFDPNNAAASFIIAKEPYDDGHYVQAISKLEAFKSRFPYSHRAEAELLIADCHFQLSHFVEASLAYANFTRLYPTHPKIAFASYHVGLSYWEAASDQERDQNFTRKAVTAFLDYLNRHDGHEFNAQATELVLEGQRRLMKSEFLIAKFYKKRKDWHACGYRLLGTLEKFTHTALQDLIGESMELAGYCLKKLAEDPKKVRENLLTINLEDPKALRLKAEELEQQARALKKK